MGREATLYLLERGVRLTGTDAWSWDAPFVHTRERYARLGDAGLIWEGTRRAGDRLLSSREASQSGGLAADRLHGGVFSVKIRSASAGWTRAVAILD